MAWPLLEIEKIRNIATRIHVILSKAKDPVEAQAERFLTQGSW